jgi:L-asparaginase
LILSTGGTIEKTYDESDGSLENKASTIMQKLTTHIRMPYNDLEVEVIMAKDSLHMNEDDRKVICTTIKDRSAAGDPIVVLHGTDTMENTAVYCHEHAPNPPVPVIFTGAMRPLEFANTDAMQNVSESLLAANIVDPGYYIVFHNRIFTVPNVSKDHKHGTFKAT